MQKRRNCKTNIFQQIKSIFKVFLKNTTQHTISIHQKFKLSKLQVLDLGFNLLRSLPSDAFSGISSLTLLALDGNPMSSLPEEAFRHLNSSLRGLSLGGRFLTCDCKIRWITTWIRKYDLQVTSRERNPQFCGNPQELRERSFYQLNEKGKNIRFH